MAACFIAEAPVEKTVRHRQHIMKKLGLRTSTELIRFALRQG
jgi:DNA-binding NarL/FixJ family response regulator